MLIYKTIIFDLDGVIVEKGKLYHGVKDLLKNMKNQGYKLCICTNENKQYTYEVLKTFDIAEYFVAIKSKTEGITKSQLIKQILDECACCSAIIVGNADDDSAAAYDTKCLLIRACYNNNYNDYGKVDFIINKPMEIYNTIKKINESSKGMVNENLKADKINLKIVEDKYITEINRMLEDDEARQMLGVVNFLDEKYYKDVNNRCYAILGANGEFIGIVELFDISWKNRRAELSICIKSLYRGKGYGYEAISKILYAGFQEIGLNRIWLRVLEYNCKAISLYEKIGFIREGICREESLRKGSFVNQIQMSILRNEWLTKL